MLGILVRERTEVDLDRRRVTGVDVGKIHNAADRGEPDVIQGEARLWLSVRVENDGRRRTRDMKEPELPVRTGRR